jgi:hypothetical protein
MKLNNLLISIAVVSLTYGGIAHASLVSQSIPTPGSNGTVPIASSTATGGIAWQATSTLGISGGGGVSTSTANTWSAQQTLTSSTITNGISNTGNVSSTSFTATNTSTASYYANNNMRFEVPSPAQLSALGFADANVWMLNVYASLSGVVSSTEFDFGAYHYTIPTQANFGTNDERVLITCVPGGGTQLTYTGTSSMYTFNTGDDHYYGSGITGCTGFGPSPTGTTVFATWGGTQGAEGFNMTDNTIERFGSPFTVATNTWSETMLGNVFTQNGMNGTFATSSNSGETPNIAYNTFSEPYATTTNCVYFALNSIAGANINGNHFDDCWPFFGNGAQGATASANHFENPGWLTYNASNGPVPWEVIASSSFTQVTNVGNFFVNDESSSTANTPAELVRNGGSFSSTGDTVNSLNVPIANFDVDVASFGSSMITSFHNVSSSVTSVINGETAANGCQIVMTNLKSWSSDICVTSSNLFEFINGGAIRGVMDANGFWDLGGPTESTVTLNVDSSASSTLRIGSGSTNEGCQEWYLSNGTEVFTYPSSATSTATTSTKPSFCQ